VAGYDEIRGEPIADGPVTRRFVRPWRINWLRGEDYYRVLLRARRPAWTLFLHGPRTKGWGFVQNGVYRPMARDGSEFRHRDWWRHAPRGAAMRAGRQPVT
jgi:hypothetical protein